MKKSIYYLLIFFPAIILGQSTDQNYVINTIYKTPTPTTFGSIPNPEQGLVNITYFDGMGRPVQQIAHKQSSEGKDIITHIEYDAFGRQAKEYLPYVTTAANPNFRTDARPRTISYYQDNYNDPYPFSEKQFENSPLNRIIKQGAPGESWQLTYSHTIDFQYNTNVASEVKLFKANTGVITNGAYNATLGNSSGNVYYPANELYKTIVIDENGSKTEEFKDKEGKVILKRAYNGTIKHDTYYVYDIFGNLTYVIPPKAVDMGTIDTTILHNLCYQYRYDARNRLVEKKIPGRGTDVNYALGWEYIVYDKLDRVVAVGPFQSPFSNQTGAGWIITKYDVLGRVAYTGWSNINNASIQSMRNSLQTSVNGGNLYVNKQNTTINGVNIGYDVNNVYPLASDSNFHLLIVNYYDDYNYPDTLSSLPTTIEGQNVTNKTKGLLTGSWIRVVTTTMEKLFEMTHTFYDSKARPVRVYQKNHLDGYTQTDTKLDFIGTTQYTITKHKRKNEDTEITVREDFEYTPQGRLSEHKHKINSLAAETLSYNEYDKLGQLKAKKTGGTSSNPLQTVDYKYNIRGWVTDINNVDNLGSDLFAFKINYNQTYHYIPSGPGKPLIRYFSLFNGNIAETYWRSSSDNVLRKYGYSYDGLNRLNNAYYIKPNNSEHRSAFVNSYNESITYDKNGNITSLYRTGDLDSVLDQIVIDDLVYVYDSGNKLIKVTDSSNHPEGFKDGANIDEEYKYDNLGNMIRDYNKGITSSITYNHLNLPKKITFENNQSKNISYIYNALGQKVRKVVTNGSETKTTDYQSGFHYENEVLRFFATSEGYVNVNITGYNYVYNYTDHLGNVRLSYMNDRLLGLLILDENHYYPFGLKHKGYEPPPTYETKFKYKYNGKEYQDELGLNFYDYHARNYDPAIGRWMNIDPLAENSRRWTPYNYAYNNPIYFIDSDGMQAYPPTELDTQGIEMSSLFDGALWTDSDGSWSFNANSNSWEGINGTDFNVPVQAQTIEEVTIEGVTSNSTVNVFTETDGVGHTYIQVGGYVFSNGRYNGSDSPSMGAYGVTGDNVLIKYSGQEATDFINSRTTTFPTTIQKVNNVNASDVFSHLNQRYNNGTSNTGGSGVVDGGYNLFSRNCTTCTTEALNAGGTNFSASAPKALPFQINIHNSGINPKTFFRDAQMEALKGSKF